MRIRPETPQDAAGIGMLISAAFRTAAHASGTEARIVADLRADGALRLSLVAERQGRLVGYVAASPATTGGQGGWPLIGPLAVRPDCQRQGIGSALMRATLDRLRATGAPGAVLVGDPAYYGRFGFRSHAALTLPGVPAEVVLALPFGSDGPAGRLGHHAAFGLE